MADLTGIYSAGTISVAAGGTTVTGVGTSWVAALIRAGDIFCKSDLSSMAMVTENPTSPTSLKIEAWPGAALAAGSSYKIIRLSDAGRLADVMMQFASDLATNVAALAGLALAANKGLYATGAGALGTYDLTSQARAMLGSTTPAVQSLGFVPANKGGDTFTGDVKVRVTSGIANLFLQTADDVAAGNSGLNLDQTVSGGFLWQYANKYLAFGANNIERMRIAAAGEITMPFQPAFHATGGNAFTGSGIVDFSTVLLNRGSVFNTTNWRFTAPVAGAYAFSANVLCTPSVLSEIAFYKNGSIISNSSRSETIPPTGMFNTIGTSALIYLAANDYVQVFSAVSTSGVYQNYRNFSGFLVG